MRLEVARLKVNTNGPHVDVEIPPDACIVVWSDGRLWSALKSVWLGAFWVELGLQVIAGVGGSAIKEARRWR